MNTLLIGGRGLFLNGSRLSVIGSPTPEPSLPPYTIRVKFTEGVTPTFSYGTGVQVSSSPNIWDLTYENASWYRLLRNKADLLEVIGANATGVTDMRYMFQGCINLTSVHLFDTSSVTTLNYMFSGCTGLTTVPLFNISSAINISYMFQNCSGLTTVPLFNTSSATNIGYMFYKCTSLTTVPLFDTSSATSINYMFYNCTSLTTVPLFNTSSATNMNSMFYGCSALTTVPLFNTSSVTNMSNMFYGCTNVQSGALALYQQASSQVTVPTHNSTFTNCGSDTTTGAAELAQIPADWGGTGS